MGNQRIWEGPQRQSGRAETYKHLVEAAGRAEREQREDVRKRIQHSTLKSKRLMDAIIKEKAVELRRCQLCDIVRAEEWGLGHDSWWTRVCSACWTQRATAESQKLHGATDAGTESKAAEQASIGRPSSSASTRHPHANTQQPPQQGQPTQSLESTQFDLEAVIAALRARDADALVQLLDDSALELHFGVGSISSAEQHADLPATRHQKGKHQHQQHVSLNTVSQGHADHSFISGPDPYTKYYHDLVLGSYHPDQLDADNIAQAQAAQTDARESSKQVGGACVQSYNMLVAEADGRTHGAAAGTSARPSVVGTQQVLHGSLDHASVPDVPRAAAGTAMHAPFGSELGGSESESDSGSASGPGNDSGRQEGKAVAAGKGARPAGALHTAGDLSTQAGEAQASRTAVAGRAGTNIAASTHAGRGQQAMPGTSPASAAANHASSSSAPNPAGRAGPRAPLPSAPKRLLTGVAEMELKLKQTEHELVWADSQAERSAALFYADQLRHALADLRILDRMQSRIARTAALHAQQDARQRRLAMHPHQHDTGDPAHSHMADAGDQTPDQGTEKGTMGSSSPPAARIGSGNRGRRGMQHSAQNSRRSRSCMHGRGGLPLEMVVTNDDITQAQTQGMFDAASQGLEGLCNVAEDAVQPLEASGVLALEALVSSIKASRHTGSKEPWATPGPNKCSARLTPAQAIRQYYLQGARRMHGVDVGPYLDPHERLDKYQTLHPDKANPTKVVDRLCTWRLNSAHVRRMDHPEGWCSTGDFF